jgi:hypothetical protein
MAREAAQQGIHLLGSGYVNVLMGDRGVGFFGGERCGRWRWGMGDEKCERALGTRQWIPEPEGRKPDQIRFTIDRGAFQTAGR